jgi:hypothetical protein
MNLSHFTFSSNPQLTEQARIDLLRGVSRIIWRLSDNLSELDLDAWHFHEDEPGVDLRPAD